MGSENRVSNETNECNREFPSEMHQLKSQYLLASECASDKYKMFLPPPPFLVKESSPVFLKIILINREIGFLIKVLTKL